MYMSPRLGKVREVRTNYGLFQDRWQNINNAFLCDKRSSLDTTIEHLSIYMYKYLCMYTKTQTHTHARTHVRTYARTYVRTYVCVCICI